MFGSDRFAETSLVGALALEFELITREQLVEVQAHVGGGTQDLVGGELVERELITETQLSKLKRLAELVETRAQDRVYSEMIVETGFVSPDEIDYAFQAQEALYTRDRSIKMLGALLVDYGAIDRELRDEILAQQGRRCTD